MASPGGFAYPGAPDPMSHPSPGYGSPQSPGYGSPQSPGGGQAITPGAITYTTSTGPDGKVIYHPFRAVPASYQTPNGKVTGIQWVPAEATQMLPNGAQPATAEFAASWNRGQQGRDDDRSLKQWQHDEDKRRRKEEKQSAKRVAQYERERRERERDRDEDDARGGYPSISRRKSFVGAPGAPAGGYANGYPTSPGGYGATSDLTDRFGGMGIDGRGPAQGGYDRSPTYGPQSSISPSGGGIARPRKYSVGDQDRRRSTYGAAGLDGSGYPPTSGYAQSGGYPVAPTPQAGGMYPNEPGYTGTPAASGGYSSSYAPAGGEPYPRAASPYARAASPYGGPRAPSPYGAGGPGAGGYTVAPQPRSRAPSPVGMYPRSRAGSPVGVYPRAISRAASPVGGIGGGGYIPRGNISRAPSPMGGPSPYGAPTPSFPQPGIGGYPAGAGPSPNMSTPATLAGSGGYGSPQAEQLAAPPGFSRPVNPSQPYTPFDTIKIQDMDDFMNNTPKMPLVLQPHDVYHEDWTRLMQDLSLAWTGKLPIGDGRPPRRQTLTGDLVDLWNSSFLLARGVELVLYKGAERRSGPNAGTIDRHIAAYDVNDTYSDSSSSDTSDSDSDSSDDDGPRTGYGAYGRQGEYGDDRRRQKEKKREKKRRHKEKKARKKAKARSKKYAVYLTYIPRGSGMPGAMGMSPAMGMTPGMGGGHMPGGY